jgi:hypothetical protein
MNVYGAVGETGSAREERERKGYWGRRMEGSTLVSPAGHQWLTPVILATSYLVAEIRRITHTKRKKRKSHHTSLK